MKPSPLIALAATAGIVAAAVLTAGCSTTRPGTPTTTSLSAPAMSSQSSSATFSTPNSTTTTTQPSHPVSYSSQVVLPFTGLKAPNGVAVDTAGNLYVADVGNHRVMRLAVGASAPSELPFTGLNNPQEVTVDTAGTVYVTDGHLVLKLPAQ
jgi:serine/threonine protein kinase, bacterial